MKRQMTDAIQFYSATDAYGELSNYYVLSAPLVYKKKTYASSEHLYHALKFLGPGASSESLAYAEVIRNAKTPNMAKVLAKQRVGGGYAWREALNPAIEAALAQGVRPRADWDKVKLDRMCLVLVLKFKQNEHCREVLLSTGDKRLVEHSSNDKFWADGGDGSGENHLGKLLVQVRRRLDKSRKQ